MVVDIVSRTVWTLSQAPRQYLPLERPAENVFLGYSRSMPCRGTSCGAQLRVEYHRHIMVKQLSDIAYSFMIDEEGVVYEGRGMDMSPSLPVRYKNLARRSLYVVLLGWYTYTPPEDFLFEKRAEFLEYSIKAGLLKEQHREFII